MLRIQIPDTVSVIIAIFILQFLLGFTAENDLDKRILYFRGYFGNGGILKRALKEYHGVTSIRCEYASHKDKTQYLPFRQPT